MILPDSFIGELETVLGDDTEKYLNEFNKMPYRGISVNHLKTDPDTLLPLLPFAAEPSPFYSSGYYIPPGTEGIGALALHHAGAFYVQEPSASCAAELLDPRPGDRVLDLCAAPGGKSAQLASLLGGSGLIWSNEPIKSRARILLSNSERMGAPCSGEGMFRKNNEAVSQWSREQVLSCAERQLSILKNAVLALREGGVLVYSTCTFSPEENEMTVEKLLEECPQLEPYDLEISFGRPTAYKNAVRITPMEGGEGHFAARFRKKGNAVPNDLPRGRFTPPSREQKKLIDGFLNDIFVRVPDYVPEVMGSSVFLRPSGLEGLKAPGIIRSGIYAGEIVKGRIEPAHSLFTTAEPADLRRVLHLGCSDPDAGKYLSGQEIDWGGEKGYTAVAIEGMITGFGKCSGGRLKNKYPKGLREFPE